ncbi:MAG: PucR family transcriptional regulator [Actinomycetia bacterium]|jgi:purine catabolism regulator|nr:PucR family transcriptional regulator [Actinomycetes bacterium]
MPPSLRTVTDLPGLGLRRLAGPDGRDREVRWVAVSELEDPGPFLEGGELLLTTGLRLPDDDAAVLDGYVTRLVDAGVTALGLGVGLSHADVPAPLVAAAEQRGLPLLEVPARTPFIAVSKAVSALLAAEEYEGMTRAFEAQLDLTRAALAGPAAVVSRLARAVDGWAVQLGPDGGVQHAAPADAAERLEDLGAEVARVRRQGLLSAAAVAGDHGHVALRPLGARGQVRGVLVVGAARAPDRTGHSVVSVAVSLLSLALERDDPTDAARAALRRATLDLLLAGAAAEALPLADLGWAWLADAPLRWVAVVGPPPERAAAVGALAAGPGGADRAVVERDDEVAVLVRDEPGPVAATGGCLGAVRAGGSAPCRLDTLGAARAQARQAAGGRRAPGVRWFDQLPVEGLLAALDPDAAGGFAAALLGPLEGRRGDLLVSLAAWLRHHGAWDAAATELGVHRHTLRYRMRRVEEALGRSLDDADLRAELWVALRVRGLAGPSPGGPAAPES